MRIPILMYHSVAEPSHTRERDLCLPPDQFARQMNYLHEQGYTPIPLDLLLAARCGSATLPARPVLLTFDDGYADNLANALPVLQRYRFAATLFVVSGRIGAVNAWDAVAGVAERRLLSWDEVRQLHGSGIAIGSHSVTHPRLQELDPQAAWAEILSSKEAIEEQLAAPVRHFCYPYGGMSESVGAQVRQAGYLSACTTQPGFNGANLDPFALRRLDIRGSDTLRQFTRKLSFGSNDGSLAHALRYFSRRVLQRVGGGR